MARIFDAAHYWKSFVQAPGFTPLAALEHYLEVGRVCGFSPTALFDAQHYCAQLGPNTAPVDPYQHYLTFGSERGLSPHPLFDVEFYAASGPAGDASLTPLEHYLTAGWRKKRSPHLLFDLEYYRHFAQDESDRVDPLTHYLRREVFDAAPHYLFSDAYYIRDIQRRIPAGHRDAYRGGAPLVHYVKKGFRYLPSLHPLFDSRTYRDALLEREHAERRTTSGETLDWLSHYCRNCLANDISPSPFFDMQFYLRQLPGDPGQDPLRHYLTEGFGSYSPHPAIDLNFYAESANFNCHFIPSVLHLLATPKEQRCSPHPFLNTDYYREQYPHIGEECPILHFMRVGIASDFAPNRFFSRNYAQRKAAESGIMGRSALWNQLARNLRKPVRMVLISHSANLTGAPAIALQILQHLSSHENVECYSIIGTSGERLSAFAKAAHTQCTGRPIYTLSTAEIAMIVDELLQVTHDSSPVIAIVNSAESRFFIPELKRRGVKVVSLVHEAATLYGHGSFEDIAEWSDLTIFPSEYVFRNARRVVNLDDDRVRVRGQGMIQSIPERNSGLARASVLKHLNLPEDVFLVLGCGTVDFRKGADLFVGAAAEVLRRKRDDQKVCFVWVGHVEHDEFYRLLKSEVIAQGREHEIRFIGKREDTSRFFAAADAFLLTSRIDPYPLVCQEAMAAGLPVIAFQEGGGAAEMVGSEAGICVSLGNISGMADAVLRVLDDPELRARLGAAGRAIVAAKWNPAHYLNFIADEIVRVVPIDPSAFGKPQPAPRAGCVYLVVGHFDSSLKKLEILATARDMASKGQEVVILLTCPFPGGERGPAADRLGDWAEIPVTYLLPATALNAEGVWFSDRIDKVRALVEFARQAQPCTFVFYEEDVWSRISELLPPAVRVLTRLRGLGSMPLMEAQQQAQHVDGIVSWYTAEPEAQMPSRFSTFARNMPVRLAGPEKKPEDRIYCWMPVLTDTAARDMLELGRLLRNAGCHLQLHVDIAPPDTRRSISAGVGLDGSQVMVDATEKDVLRELDACSIMIIIGNDEMADFMVRLAWSRGTVPIVINGSAEIERLLRESGGGLSLFGSPGSAARVILPLARDRDSLRKMLNAAQVWSQALSQQRPALAEFSGAVELELTGSGG